MDLLANISFEEFYYIDDGQLHKLLDVQDEYEHNNGDISKYRGRMFCPECKQAELSFTHKTSKRRAFLSKIPSSNHKVGCSFMYDYASNKEMKEFIEELTDKEIQDRLESMLNRLLPREKKEDVGETNDVENNPFIIEREGENKNRIRKSIRRKSIGSWFDKSEENIVSIFYGHVKLEIEEVKTKNGICFRWNVKTKKENNWIKKTSIFRGKIKDKIDENKTYDIAVLGCIEFYKDFPQIRSANFSSIMFRESRS